MAFYQWHQDFRILLEIYLIFDNNIRRKLTQNVFYKEIKCKEEINDQLLTQKGSGRFVSETEEINNE